MAKQTIDAVVSGYEDIQTALLDNLLYFLPGRCAMLSAYLDESGTHQSAAALCVGGLLFTKRNAKQLNREWKKVLNQAGISHFHLVDKSHLRGEFEGKSRRFADDVYRKLLALTNQYASGGVGVGCALSEKMFNKLRLPNRQISRYAASMIVGMQLMSIVAQQLNHKRISFFIESGHKDEGQLAVIAKRLFQTAGLPGSCVFADKKELRPLQTADILVYELNKHFTELKKAESSGMEPRPTRGSLRSLAGLGDNLQIQFIAESNIQRLLNQFSSAAID